MAQAVKNLPAMWETHIWSLGQGDPLEEGMTTHSSILAWRIPLTEEPGGLQTMGSRRVRHGWVSNTWTLLLLCILTKSSLCRIRASLLRSHPPQPSSLFYDPNSPTVQAAFIKLPGKLLATWPSLSECLLRNVCSVVFLQRSSTLYLMVASPQKLSMSMNSKALSSLKSFRFLHMDSKVLTWKPCILKLGYRKA